MKKIIFTDILLGLCAILLLSNCGGDSVNEGPTLSVYPESLTFEANGTQKTIKVVSNTKWEVRTQDSWVSCSPGSGKGPSDITISPQTNTGEKRTTKITIVCLLQNSNNKEVIVTQEKADSQTSPTNPDQSLSVNPSSLNFSSSADSKTFNITSNTSWTVKSNETWCTVNTASGSNNATVTVNVTENTSTSSARNATITVSNSSASATIMVSQEAAGASLSVSTTSVNFTENSGNKDVTIKSNTSWKASSSENWLTVSPSQGNGDGTLTLSASANTTTSERNAIVTVDYDNRSLTIAVSQEAANASLTVSPTIVNFTDNGGSKDVTIKSNSSWKASSNGNWLTISPSQGTGDGTLTLTATTNTTTSGRNATVTIEYGNHSATISINQDAMKQEVSSEIITVKGINFKMIKVEGGTFTMGATPEQNWTYDNEKPTHSVTLSTYYIGETEVTQELWEAVMGKNPSEFKSARKPVETVSWNDCQTFITKLNALTGKNFRFPTEAEWEYAARGGNKSKGYEFSGSNNLNDVAWHKENSRDVGESSSNYGTHTVATKRANELGIYDMSGNVNEWCQDWYGDYSAINETNPKGPSSGSKRVYRGGGWYGHGPWFCRISFRTSELPNENSTAWARGIIPDIGLRLAR